MHRAHITVLIEQKSTTSPQRVALLRDQVLAAGYRAEILHGKTNVEIVDRVVQAAAAGPVMVLDSSLVVTQSMMDMLLESGWTQCSALVARHSSPSFDTAVRVGHGRVVSSGSEIHRVSSPTHMAMGLLRIAQDRPAVQALLRAREYAESIVMPMDSVGILTLALVRANIPVHAIEPTGPCSRVGGEASESVIAITSTHDDDFALARAGRNHDGAFTTFVVRYLAKPVTKLAQRRGISAIRVAVASLATALVAALAFSHATRSALAVGAGLALVSIVLDRSAGDLDRLQQVSSPLVTWFEQTRRLPKEFAMYAGLAAGVSHHHIDLWATAMAAVVVQTVRYIGQSNLDAVSAIRETSDLTLPLTQVVDLPSVGPSRWLDRDAALESRTIPRWIKRIVEFHMGERWLVIIVCAALGQARTALSLTLLWGLVALAYLTVRGLLRSSTWGPDVHRLACDILERELDYGALMRSVTTQRNHPMTKANSWFTISTLRFAELGLIALAGHSHPWAYLWLVAVAYRHIDGLQRSINGEAYPVQLANLGLGFDVRSLILLAAVMFTDFQVAAFAGGWYFLYVLVALPSVRRARYLGVVWPKASRH